MFYQSVFIILGGLLSVSEVLPFINQTAANGILDFLIQTFIKQEEEEQKSLQAPLLNYDDDILKLTDYICKISNENKDELKTFIVENLLENSENLQKLLIKKLDTNKASFDRFFSSLSERNVKADLAHDINYNKLNDSIKEVDENISNILKNLILKSDINYDSIQEILNKPSINNNDIVGVCEMILQHLQDLQRKYVIQNNTLLESLNKYNNDKKEINHDNYDEKITVLLQELTTTQEAINTVIKNHSDESKNLELTHMLQLFLKNQDETNKHILEIFNLLNKKKKMNLFFNNSNTSNTISRGSSSETNGN